VGESIVPAQGHGKPLSGSSVMVDVNTTRLLVGRVFLSPAA
jgi:hypothetical protein